MNKDARLKLVRFFNFYPLKEKLMRWQYHDFNQKSHNKPFLISTIDEKRKSQGMADRFKGIVSVYALAKAKNIDFRIIYNTPFHLQDFLQPNQYDWIPKDDDLNDSFFGTEYCILRKYPSIKRLINKLPSKKQIRVYANLDYLGEINQLFGKDYHWGTLFLELFKPTEQLQKEINFHLNKIGGNYVACVFRFQNLLGDFQEYRLKALSVEERQKLIKKNKQALNDLLKNNPEQKILVTSDSITFLEEVKMMQNIYTVPGKIVHVDSVKDEEYEVYQKSFLDFYLIANAQKVYSIGTEQMYPTQFPMYAAKVYNRSFERIKID